MRRAAKVDSTHAEIRDALRAAGVSVLSLANHGRGVPDFLCSYRAYTCLLEAKTGKNELTEDQRDFIRDWGGVVIVANTPESACAKFFQAYALGVLAAI